MSVSYKFLTGALQDWTLGCWQEREESAKQLNHEKKYVYPLTKTWTLQPLKATGFHFLFTVSLNQMLILANKGNDHQFNKLLIVKQILLVSPIGNIKRTEKRIWILQLRLRKRGKKAHRPLRRKAVKTSFDNRTKVTYIKTISGCNHYG